MFPSLSAQKSCWTLSDLRKTLTTRAVVPLMARRENAPATELEADVESCENMGAPIKVVLTDPTAFVKFEFPGAACVLFDRLICYFSIFFYSVNNRWATATSLET
jgi:hypothetical protein